MLVHNDLQMKQKFLKDQYSSTIQSIFLALLLISICLFIYSAPASAAVGDNWKQKCETYNKIIDRVNNINSGAAHGYGKTVDVNISAHQKSYNELCKPNKKPKNAKDETTVNKEIQKKIDGINNKLEEAGYSKTHASPPPAGGAAAKPSTDEKADPALSCDPNSDCNLYEKYVNPIITLLAGLVAIAVTIGIISGGIRYATASDDPQKMSAAKHQIQNAIIALLAFIFLYAAIKWLAPAA